jgi:hypothetical protein
MISDFQFGFSFRAFGIDKTYVGAFNFASRICLKDLWNIPIRYPSGQTIMSPGAIMQFHDVNPVDTGFDPHIRGYPSTLQHGCQGDHPASKTRLIGFIPSQAE